MSDKISLPLVNVEIDRGKDCVTVEIPKHEVRVLQAVHGKAKVREVGDADAEREFDGSCEAEYDRMQRTYFRINQPDPVALAYPVGPEQLEAFGFTVGGEASKAPPMSLVKKNKKPKAAKATAKAEESKGDGKKAA